jgi:hypothetical protein
MAFLVSGIGGVLWVLSTIFEWVQTGHEIGVFQIGFILVLAGCSYGSFELGQTLLGLVKEINRRER